jgi:hypothetical protein
VPAIDSYRDADARSGSHRIAQDRTKHLFDSDLQNWLLAKWLCPIARAVLMLPRPWMTRRFFASAVIRTAGMAIAKIYLRRCAYNVPSYCNPK